MLARDFALILLDVNMPGLDGLETAALIRNRKRSAHIPIIFITADYADELRTTKGYSLGAVDYITSPIVPEVLRAKVRVFVDLYLLAEQAKQQAQQRIALAEEKAARQAAERATRRLAFLAEATGTLAASLDVEAASRELAKLLVPLIADASVLALHHDGHAETPMLSWKDAAAPDGVATQPLEGPLPAWLAGLLAHCDDGGKAMSVRPPSAEAVLRRPALHRAGDRRGAVRAAGGPRTDARRAGRSASRRAIVASTPTRCRWRPTSRAAPRSRSTTRCCIARSTRRTGARTSSSRCSRTSSAIRSRRSATRCTSSTCRSRTRSARAGRAT